MTDTTRSASSSHGLDFERILPLFVLVFVDVLGLTVILPLLHLYGAAFGASPAQIGLVAAAFPLAQLAGVPVMGALSDRFGRKPILIISQVSTFFGFLLLASAHSMEVLLLSRMIDGLFGANLATAQAALSDVTDEANRTRALGLTGAAFGLGFIFGPLISIMTLEMTDSLMAPALAAAGYSFVSILLTVFLFKETLPPEKRSFSTRRSGFSMGSMVQMVLRPALGVLMLLMFAQQVIFFGFESLMGLFTLSRLGLMGQGNALLFLFIGILLVMVQVRYIGKWSRKYGERNLVFLALAMIASGLVLFALTPEQPHPFYVQRNVEFDLRDQALSSTEAMIGKIDVALPADGNNGFGGMLWLLVALVPLSIGSGLIRPCLNSLMTKRVSPHEYGAVLGVSTAFVSAANALAPLAAGMIFQSYGASAPFLSGGILMFGLLLLSIALIRK